MRYFIFQKVVKWCLYTEVEKLTKEIVADVLKEIFVYPDHQLHLVWNYQEDFKRLLLDVEEDENLEKE